MCRDANLAALWLKAQRVQSLKTRLGSGTESSGFASFSFLKLSRTDTMPFIEHVSFTDLERLALDRFVPALLTHGFCYVDGLLGDLAGGAVLDQVTEMHRAGELQDGRLAGSVPGVSRRSIRGDKIAWVGGSERGCEAVSFLLNLIDRLVAVCASRLGATAIRERSKVRVRPPPGGNTWVRIRACSARKSKKRGSAGG